MGLAASNLDSSLMGSFFELLGLGVQYSPIEAYVGFPASKFLLRDAGFQSLGVGTETAKSFRQHLELEYIAPKDN